MDYQDVFRSSVSYATRIYEITERVKQYDPEADFDLINRAYVFAAQAHGPQKRKSGELFITHPLAVAGLLAQMGMDVETVITGLLHDTVEDTDVSLDDIAHHFGSTVAHMVDGVTKIEQIPIATKQIKQAENLRKMILSMSQDIRVIFVKLADRLHNMSTMGSMPHAVAKQKADECLEIYAPLASRLGVYWIKQALQDLALFINDKETFSTLSQLRDEAINALTYSPDAIANVIKTALAQRDVQAEVTWRAKHIHSLYFKIHEKNIPFSQIRDLLAFRIVVKDRATCYLTLGLIHELYQYQVNTFKDYIGTPKNNGYESLHTSVYGPGGSLIEVQIRSEEMHAHAENGLAAHWIYKDKLDPHSQQSMAWLKSLADISVNTPNAQEFLHSVQMDLFIQEVIVFSRDGDLYSLPRTATPLDFAYAIHSDVGNQCQGVRINGKNAPLDQRLRNGDRIEIITNPEQSPSLSWKKLVKTSRAQHAIRQHFKKQDKQASILLGEKIIHDVSQAALPESIINQLGCNHIDEVKERLGRGELTVDRLFRAVYGEQQSMNLNGIQQNLLYPASCCRPIPGDNIVGSLVKNRGFELHYHRCKQVLNKPHRDWKPFEWEAHDGHLYQTSLELETENQRGMLAKLSAVIAGANADIEDLRMHQLSGSLTILSFLVEVQDRTQLNEIIRLLREIHGVIKIRRNNLGRSDDKGLKPLNHAVSDIHNKKTTDQEE